jgi:hypothetical protein
MYSDRHPAFVTVARWRRHPAEALRVSYRIAASDYRRTTRPANRSHQSPRMTEEPVSSSLLAPG